MTEPTLPTPQLLTQGQDADGLSGRPLCAALLVASARPRSVLDVGCKSGWLLAYLARHGQAGAVLVGVDRDEVSPPGPDSPARVLRGDARRLPLASERFEAVTLLDVIEHLPRGSEPAALAEATRVLRPGGLLFLSTPADWLPGTLLDPARWLIGHRHYPMARVLDLVAGAGLEPILAETRGGWADVVTLPLLYASTRLRLPLPAAARLGRWANREYARPGRYTHFVVGSKPGRPASASNAASRSHWRRSVAGGSA